MRPTGGQIAWGSASSNKGMDDDDAKEEEKIFWKRHTKEYINIYPRIEKTYTATENQLLLIYSSLDGKD